MNTIKKTPQRTCVVCRTIGGKRGLLRVVRSPEGRVSVDPSGRLPGRGAYLCREPGCLNGALTGNQIEHVLKLKLSHEGRESLRQSISEFIKEQAVV